MNVTFTSRQMQAVDRMTACAPLLNEALDVDHRTPHGKYGWAINAPYIAWVQVRELMSETLFKMSGARKPQFPYAAGKAHQRLVTAINTADRHPALRDMAMEGFHAGSFPVWEQPPDARGKVWSMSPIPGAPFTILCPTWEFGLGITYWSPRDSEVGRPGLRDEARHLKFIGL